MNFVLTEFTKPQKRYSISQKVETNSGSSWKEVAEFKQRSTAFFFINLIEKLSN